MEVDLGDKRTHWILLSIFHPPPSSPQAHPSYIADVGQGDPYATRRSTELAFRHPTTAYNACSVETAVVTIWWGTGSC